MTCCTSHWPSTITGSVRSSNTAAGSLKGSCATVCGFAAENYYYALTWHVVAVDTHQRYNSSCFSMCVLWNCLFFQKLQKLYLRMFSKMRISITKINIFFLLRKIKRQYPTPLPCIRPYLTAGAGNLNLNPCASPLNSLIVSLWRNHDTVWYVIELSYGN